MSLGLFSIAFLSRCHFTLEYQILAFFHIKKKKQVDILFDNTIRIHDCHLKQSDVTQDRITLDYQI